MAPIPLWSAVILTSLLCGGLSLRDLTEFPNASGVDVVDAVIARLDSEFDSSVDGFWAEGDDSVFFKDLALVESEYGVTYTDDNGGGIWQVPQDEFDETKDFLVIRTNRDYAEKIEQVSDTLGIAWQTVERDELAKPLHSLIAARLVLHLRADDDDDGCDSVPTIDDKRSYAEYWFNCYRDGVGDISDFAEIINVDLEVCDFASDIVFLLDSSGSINYADPENWNRIKYFTGNFTATLLGNSNNRNFNRVGIVTFSYEATVQSPLTNDRDELLSLIETLPYDGYNTNTAEGLCKLLDMNWDEDKLRLVIVMTDGMSNSDSVRCGTTIEAPVAVNSQLCPSPLYYVIGVTDNVNQTELEAIATSQAFIDHLDSFENTESLASLRRQRTYQICFRGSALICEGTLSKTDLPRGDKVRYQVDVEDGVTVRLCIDGGQVFLYASDTVPTPNRALNTFSFEGALQSEPKCEDLFINPLTIELLRELPVRGKKRQAPTPSEGITLYLSIEGVAENSSFTLETLPGNESAFSTSCSDNLCGANTVCIDEILGYSCNCLRGYEFEANLKDCQDINECEQQPAPCSPSAVCTNTNGSHECTCHIGYSGDGRKCALQKNTEQQFIAAVACGVGGGLVAMVVILAALVTIYKAMTAKKGSKYHEKGDRRHPSNHTSKTPNEKDETHLLQSVNVDHKMQPPNYNQSSK